MSVETDETGLVRRSGLLPLRCGTGPSPWVELAEAGEGPLEGVFYEDAIRARRRTGRPLVSHRVALGSVDPAIPFDDAIPLVGLVFHVSRTGSSLAVRRLAQDPATVVVSESPAIDQIVMRELGTSDRAVHIADLRRIVALHARARTASSRRLVIKLDAWHLAATDLFADAFPAIPSVVLVREPAAVIASHRLRRGTHVVPGLVAWERLGVDLGDVAPADLDEFALRSLGAIYAGALELARSPMCRVVRYASLPGAIDARIAPWLGIEPYASTDADWMRSDAKAPMRSFDAAGDATRVSALHPELRARIAARLDPLYRSLPE